MCPAIHINSRSWLRSSSTHEPSDPPLRVVCQLARPPRAARSFHTQEQQYEQRYENAAGATDRPRLFKPRRASFPLPLESGQGQVPRRKSELVARRRRPGRLSGPARRPPRVLMICARGLEEPVRHVPCVFRFVNDPSAGSPTETLLRLLLPLDDQV